MKFSGGDSTDQDFCVALEHEFLRCHEAFQLFAAVAPHLIAQDSDRRLAYRAFSAYSDFIHHFYEFMLGAYCRERNNTGLTKKKGSYLQTDTYINHHAQRVMTIKRDAIKNGTAPSWENALSTYPETIDPLFAVKLRKIRNSATGHVDPERAKVELTTFYHEHHMVLYWLYRDCIRQWGPKDGAFPDWQAITNFSVNVPAA
jgi:hypothetical protein